MKKYNRIMLGAGSSHAQECFDGGFIGTDFGIYQDLSSHLPENWREFNKAFIPVYLENNPEKSKVTAGLACGAIWTVSKGLNIGDVILSPDGNGNYRVGEIISEYYYSHEGILPHRRNVKWLDLYIPRNEMSQSLQNSTGSIGTVCDISSYENEIKNFISQGAISPIVTNDEDGFIDPLAFAMEKHLEEFLVVNWGQTEFAKHFKIFEEDGELIGKQYQTGAGIIDILAISNDKKRLLVIELKRGRASDRVVGQVLRYMGYIKEQIATPNQTVEGAIIALEDDQSLRWAISNVPSVSFYRYQISFKLAKA